MENSKIKGIFLKIDFKNLFKKIKNNRLKYLFKTKSGEQGITVQQVAISGMMLALITSLKFLGRIMPDSPSGASWVEIYMIFASVLVLTMPFAVSLLVLVSAPFLWLALGLTTQTSPFSFFLDYSFPVLSIMIVYLARFIPEKDEKKVFTYKKLAILLLLVLGFVIKFLSHTLSGVLFYKVTFSASAVINGPAVFITLGTTVAVLLAMIAKISIIQKLVNQKGYGW